MKDCCKQSKEDVIKEVRGMIDAEMGCIYDGNTLTPTESNVAIKVAENIRVRIDSLSNPTTP